MAALGQPVPCHLSLPCHLPLPRVTYPCLVTLPWPATSCLSLHPFPKSLHPFLCHPALTHVTQPYPCHRIPALCHRTRKPRHWPACLTGLLMAASWLRIDLLVPAPCATTTQGPRDGCSGAVTHHLWLGADTKPRHCTHLLEEKPRTPQIKALPSLLEGVSLEGWDRCSPRPPTLLTPAPLTTHRLGDFLFPSFPKQQGNFQAQTNSHTWGLSPAPEQPAQGKCCHGYRGIKKYNSDPARRLGR